MSDANELLAQVIERKDKRIEELEAALGAVSNLYAKMREGIIAVANDEMVKLKAERDNAEESMVLSAQLEHEARAEVVTVKAEKRTFADFVVILTEKLKTMTADLAAMTDDRDAWNDQHDGDCPHVETVREQAEEIVTLGEEADARRVEMTRLRLVMPAFVGIRDQFFLGATDFGDGIRRLCDAALDAGEDSP